MCLFKLVKTSNIFYFNSGILSWHNYSILPPVTTGSGWGRSAGNNTYGQYFITSLKFNWSILTNRWRSVHSQKTVFFNDTFYFWILNRFSNFFLRITDFLTADNCNTSSVCMVKYSIIIIIIMQWTFPLFSQKLFADR